MNYEKIENEIVERLQIKGVETDNLPHIGKLNEARRTGKPQLYVLVNGGNLDPPVQLEIPVQKEFIKAEIFIRAKERRGELGIFYLYEMITDRLMGFKPSGAAGGIVFEAFGYVAGNLNDWQYMLSFSFPTFRVPVATPSETGTIKKLQTTITKK